MFGIKKKFGTIPLISLKSLINEIEEGNVDKNIEIGFILKPLNHRKHRSHGGYQVIDDNGIVVIKNVLLSNERY